MSAVLAGKTVAFTGEFAGMTQNQIASIAQAAGAHVTNVINRKTDFLVCGKAPGPEVPSALANKVTLLSQPQFARFTKNIAVPTPKAAAVRQTQAYAAAPTQAAGQFQYPPQYMAMMNKAPRGRRPAAAVQTYAAPAPQAYSAPAPVAAFTNKAVTLPGKSLTFTGSLETATRDEAAAMATQAGATVSSVITPQTSYLVCGANPGQTKLIASQAAGVANISEAQFMKAAIPAVNAMPETAAPAMTYAAPTMMSTRGRKPRAVAAPAAPMAYAPAPVAYEAPTTGAMPWETEIVGQAAAAAPAMMMAAPKVHAPKKMAAPMTYAAPVAQTYAAPTPVAKAGTITLAGQNVVFTGALQVNRMVAATMATKAGASVSAALSASTNLLVCGANAGEKMAKAQGMGIRAITEAEFVAACRN